MFGPDSCASRKVCRQLSRVKIPSFIFTGWLFVHCSTEVAASLENRGSFSSVKSSACWRISTSLCIRAVRFSFLWAVVGNKRTEENVSHVNASMRLFETVVDEEQREEDEAFDFMVCVCACAFQSMNADKHGNGLERKQMSGKREKLWEWFFLDSTEIHGTIDQLSHRPNSIPSVQITRFLKGPAICFKTKNHDFCMSFSCYLEIGTRAQYPGVFALCNVWKWCDYAENYLVLVTSLSLCHVGWF